ncbi:MAG: hypothetical protein ACOX2F_06435 [bacterium]
MKNYFVFLLTALFFLIFVSCESKRPDSLGEFSYLLKINSILSNGEVEIIEDETVIAAAVTDESGSATFNDVKTIKELTVRVCKGELNLVSSEEPVAWNGCMETKVIPTDSPEITAVVDILSTFIAKYESDTSSEEWKTYLDMTTLPYPALQSSLTDATKRYLWYQGIAKVAENVSKANGITPETMYSTENLVNLLYDDLTDDGIINGSTEAKFGALSIEAAILKSILADAIPEVSKNYTKSDLVTWTDIIRYSNAKFLGGTGSGIDSEKPVIEIETPKEGEVVFGDVKVKATATDNVKVTSLVCLLVGEEMPELEDEAEEEDKFLAEFDSKLVPDGKIKIRCIASDGTNLSEKEISVTASNSNQVLLSAFVTNPLTLWDSVSVYDSKDNKILVTSFDEGESTTISLAPGTFRIVLKGGIYEPVFLDDETIKFDSYLETRVTVKPGEKTTAYATPLTTLRERLYRALSDNGESEAETKSFTLISEHIDKDFPLYIEPVSKNQLTENSKYYIALAAIERLAVLIGERHNPPLGKGSITIEQVLKALIDDLEAEDKAVLDGFGKINKFVVDSYLFRYWYAIALKLFLESEENLTSLKFSDLQTVIHNISTDVSELFPSDEEPKKVTDKPPVISEKRFKRSYETEFQSYSVSNIIYANSDVFSVKFKALPDESGDLSIDTVEVAGDIEALSISDINEEGIYTAEVKFPATEDGDKTILITAVDDAENTGTATLQAVKDTVKPVITNLGDELPTNVTTPLTVSYSVTEINPHESLYSFTAEGELPETWTSLAPAILTGDITITDTLLADDGAYALYFKTVDKAGNETVRTKSLVFDRERPTAEFTTAPEINENGFINQNSISITIIATDNVTPENELIHEFFNGTMWVENPEEIKNVWILQVLSEQLYEQKYRVKDLAGNKSDDINISFTVDTLFPVLTTNKTVLESRAYRIDDENLQLSSTCTDTNLLTYTYSINNSEAVSVTHASMSLVNNEALREGNNTVTVECSDKAGNITTEEIEIIIDNTPPVLSVTHSPEGAVCGIATTVEVEAVDSISRPVTAHYYYSVNNMAESAVFTTNLNSSGEASLVFPGSGDTFYNNTNNYINLLNNVDFFVTAKDEAGNESAAVFRGWNIDKMPPRASFYEVTEHLIAIVIDGSQTFTGSEAGAAPDIYAFIDQKAAEAGLNDIRKIKSYINGSLRDTFTVVKNINEFREGECANFPCGGENDIYLPCRVCAHSGEVPEEFTFKVLFEDSCGNTGKVSDCKDEDYFCIEKYVNIAIPPLYITTNFTGTDSIMITLQAEGANIESCKIYKGSVFVQDCQKVQGGQVINTTSYSEGTYTVQASSKYSGGTEITTGSKNFVVDRTPFSISIDVKNGKPYYLKESPVLSYNITIASGVKSVLFALHDRTVNYRYAPPTGYNCDTSTGYCVTNSYDRIIYASSSKSANFSVPISGLFAAQGGIYTKISYVVEPNWGNTVTGEVSVFPINLIATDNEDLAIWSEGGKIRFRESIISKKVSSGNIKYYGQYHYNNMCIKTAGKPFYHHREYLVNPSYSVNPDAYESCGTITVTKPKSVYRWGRKDHDHGASADDGTCSSLSDCPSTAYDCRDRILGNEKECIAARAGKHYSDSGHNCNEKPHNAPWVCCNCNDWSGKVPCMETQCVYLRDMQYYPASAFFILTDRSNRGGFGATLKDLGVKVSEQKDCL